MPPIRTLLVEHNSNTLKRRELIKFERECIIRIYNKEVKKTVIQRFYNHLYFMISDTISNNKLRNNSMSLSRSRATKSYFFAEEKMIL